MGVYDDTYEVKRSIEECSRNNSRYKRRPANWRSSRRMWDYVLCKVCTGCGKPLSRYDVLKGYAFCYPCRRNFFPETISMNAFYGNRRR
jgi:hypothetical protein